MHHIRPWITAGLTLVGASAVAVSPVTVVQPETHGPAARAFAIQLTAADIVLDLVRHGQSTENVSDYVGTTPPGAPLTDLGQQQAIDVGNSLYNDGDNNIGGVWASDFLRAQQTAWPLVQLLAGQPVDPANFPDGPTPLLAPDQILSGLGEINAGWLEGQSGTIPGLLYLLPTIAWMTGAYWVPMLGSSVNPNGMAFQDNYSGALQTIYDASTAEDGTGHDVAFSHGAAIMAWTMMNVQNPDWGLFLETLAGDHGLPNTGQVVVEGNPTDGWTLVSWNGQDVAAQPDLLTSLFVDWRDLIVAPQMATWHIWEALLTGDPTEFFNAITQGAEQVFSALVEFPQAVIDSFVNALGDIGAGNAQDTSDLLGDLVGALAI